MNFLPVARTENIAVQNLKDEVLIYDLITNLAVCLNVTSANVFNACDGKTSFDELKSQYNYTDEIVYLALDGLKKENLLSDGYVSPFAGLSRREVIKKAGLASMIALPVISAVVAPTALMAASARTCTPNAAGCTASGGTVNSTQPSAGTCFSSAGTGGASTCCSCTANGGSSFNSRGFCSVGCV